jgi:hypothetical protein
MGIGPVQLIVLGFRNPDFHGEIIAELERLRASDTVPPQVKAHSQWPHRLGPLSRAPGRTTGADALACPGSEPARNLISA